MRFQSRPRTLMLVVTFVGVWTPLVMKRLKRSAMREKLSPLLRPSPIKGVGVEMQAGAGLTAPQAGAGDRYSLKRIDDGYVVVVLSVVQIFAEDGMTAHLFCSRQDGGVPIRDAKTLLRVYRVKDQLS
jgi:hypothetical protein